VSRIVRPLLCGLLCCLLAGALFSCSDPTTFPDLEPETGSWHWVNPLPFGYDLNAIWGASFYEAYAVGDEGVICHFDGNHLHKVKSLTREDLWDIHGSAHDNIYTVGDAGTVLRFDGLHWRLLETGLDAQLRKVWCRGRDDVYVLDDGIGLYHFDGSRWQLVDTSGEIRLLRDIWGTPAGDLYVVASDYLLLHFNGATWTTTSTREFGDLRDIWGRSASDVYAAGYLDQQREELENDGVIVHFDGTAWSIVYENLPHYSPLLSGEPEGGLIVSETTRFDRCFTYRFDDASLSMIHFSESTMEINCLTGFPDGPTIGIGNDGVLYTFDGQRVLRFNSGSGYGTGHASGTACTNIFTVYGESILHYDGEVWFPRTSVCDCLLNDVWAVTDDFAVAVGSDGIIMQWNGTHWNETDCGTFYSLNSVWGNTADNVFAVGSEGTVLQFDGDTWQASPSGTSCELYLVQGRAADDVFAIGADREYRTYIYHYDGVEWQERDGVPDVWFFALWVDPHTDDVWLGGRELYGGPGALFRYDGAVFTRVEEDFAPIRALWGLSSEEIYLATSATIWRYDGESWTPYTERGLANYTDLWGSAQCGIYAFAPGGKIRHRPADLVR